jgi:hypothetical protein
VRKALALVTTGLAAACLSAAAAAEDPVKPELGAGPHLDYREQKGGTGEKPRPGSPEPKLPAVPRDSAPPGAAGQDGASTGGSAPDADERKATESKEKAKKRPGYKDDAPSPRA